MTKFPKILRRVKSGLLRLHRNEQGAEGIEKLLILGAIALPLLAVLYWFGADLKVWVSELWGEVRGQQTDLQDNPF